MGQEDAALLATNAIPVVKNNQQKRKLARQKMAAALLKLTLLDKFSTYPRLLG
jgi:hypothetical protein